MIDAVTCLDDVDEDGGGSGDHGEQHDSSAEPAGETAAAAAESSDVSTSAPQTAVDPLPSEAVTEGTAVASSSTAAESSGASVDTAREQHQRDDSHDAAAAPVPAVPAPLPFAGDALSLFATSSSAQHAVPNDDGVNTCETPSIDGPTGEPVAAAAAAASLPLVAYVGGGNSAASQVQSMSADSSPTGPTAAPPADVVSIASPSTKVVTVEIVIGADAATVSDSTTSVVAVAAAAAATAAAGAVDTSATAGSDNAVSESTSAPPVANQAALAAEQPSAPAPLPTVTESPTAPREPAPVDPALLLPAATQPFLLHATHAQARATDLQSSVEAVKAQNGPSLLDLLAIDMARASAATLAMHREEHVMSESELEAEARRRSEADANLLKATHALLSAAAAAETEAASKALLEDGNRPMVAYEFTIPVTTGEHCTLGIRLSKLDHVQPAVVEALHPEGQGQALGLEAGDELLAINGEAVVSGVREVELKSKLTALMDAWKRSDGSDQHSNGTVLLRFRRPAMLVPQPPVAAPLEPSVTEQVLAKAARPADTDNKVDNRVGIATPSVLEEVRIAAA